MFITDPRIATVFAVSAIMMWARTLSTIDYIVDTWLSPTLRKLEWHTAILRKAERERFLRALYIFVFELEGRGVITVLAAVVLALIAITYAVRADRARPFHGAENSRRVRRAPPEDLRELVDQIFARSYATDELGDDDVYEPGFGDASDSDSESDSGSSTDTSEECDGYRNMGGN